MAQILGIQRQVGLALAATASLHGYLAILTANWIEGMPVLS